MLKYGCLNPSKCCYVFKGEPGIGRKGEKGIPGFPGPRVRFFHALFNFSEFGGISLSHFYKIQSIILRAQKWRFSQRGVLCFCSARIV